MQDVQEVQEVQEVQVCMRYDKCLGVHEVQVCRCAGVHEVICAGVQVCRCAGVLVVLEVLVCWRWRRSKR